VTALSSTKSLIIDDVIIEDSTVGIYAIHHGPRSWKHEYSDTSVTLKNSYISGKGENTFDCIYDTEVKVYLDKWSNRQGPPPSRTLTQTGILGPDFLGDKKAYPICPWYQNDLDIAIYGKTCVVNTEFANFNDYCDDERPVVVTGNAQTLDHLFPITFLTGNR
jgi:hypothetical protein